MTGLRILADDLTGALDSAAAFAGEVPVALGRPDPVLFAGAPVAAVATGTRDVPAAALAGLLEPVVPWLAGAGIAFKKVDSLLRGNTFAEVAHVARAGGFHHVVFAPAFPRQGRVTVDGCHQVPTGEGSATQRVPAGDGRLADAFVTLGLAEAPPGGAAGTPTVAVPDIRTDEDLLALAARSLEPSASRWLWCGSAGLAHAMAAVHGLAPASRPDAPVVAAAGPVLVLSASRHLVLRRQWEALRAAQPEAVAVTAGDAGELAAAGRALAAGAGLALLDLSPARPLESAEASARLSAKLEALVLGAPRPAALVVVGGDTLLALCRAAGAGALVSRPGARLGWGTARLAGGAWDGVACHSRSGAFGDPADLASMVRLLGRRAATLEESR